MEPWTIREIRNYTGLTQRQFSEYTHIPRRTLEQWETGERTPPAYLLGLLSRAIREDVDGGRFDTGREPVDITEPIRTRGGIV